MAGEDLGDAAIALQLAQRRRQRVGEGGVVGLDGHAEGPVVDLQLGHLHDFDDEAARKAVETLKQKEHDGYHYEAAEASFDLLLRREAGQYKSLFKFESFKVQTELRAGEKVETEAIVKIKVGDERYVEVAEGNGPVNALDKALRQAITRHYPELKKIELTGYRVRILDTAHGTGAGTRVLLDSKHEEGGDSWGSIGVSPNIIEASWEALVDSLAYAFQNGSGSDGD